ncbi:type VI secretion system tip protein TssI/VgrG [Pseudoduganella sp. LjRoot289]|uniref:type VI secretion system Vgr family protein n=1 Tax=Pseudoduganella sp. LjRoot289 TaxID=3342314 RepID=UPI003ED13CF6
MNAGTVLKTVMEMSALSRESQGGRLLRMDFPRGDGPKYSVMLVNTLKAREEMSRDFRFEVEVLSDDARIPLKSMMGKMVTISLVRNDGSLRYFNGYVAEFRFAGTDGGFAHYRMVLEPWLAFARLRKNNAAFYGLSVRDLTERTLEPYLKRDWRTRICSADPELRCAHQHNETDYNHLHRRWEALGLFYWYEHRADGHTLWLGDDSTLCPSIDQREFTPVPDGMPFRSESGSFEDDGVHQWQAVRRLGSGQLTLASFDYKCPRPQHAVGHSRNQQGDVFAYELYEDGGAYAYPNQDAGEVVARRRMEGQDQRTQYFEASGNDRNAQAGRVFKLDGHFSAEPRPPEPGEARRAGIAARKYLVLSVEHTASNNYHVGRNAASHYENRFECVRQEQRWRPGRHYNSEPCAHPGVQTALVVGPAGDEIHTDGYGRVKIQFHWDRAGKYDAGGTPWTRVMMPMAGPNLGQIALPRVGQEVVVQFVDGNIDHPIIMGAAYNARSQPPWGLPSQSALTGWRSRELNGGQRSNYLLLDDTSGQLQAQLRSDHLHSQLALGHIVRVDDTAGRQEARGDGWELRTDGHGVARAAKGMLLTTEARPASRSHVTSLDETARRLSVAQRSHADLAALAKPYDASDAQSQQADAVKALERQQQEVKGKSGGGSHSLSAPHLLLASPAGIAATTAGSTHLASDQHAAVSAGHSISLASGGGLFASARRALRLFVHQAGMKMIAAAGDIDLQALSDSIKLLAKLEITHTANRITITAKEEVVINGGGSYAKFTAGGIEHGTNGNYVAHAAKHSLPGPKNIKVEFTMPPISKLEGQGAFNLGSHPSAAGMASAGFPYKLFKGDALVEEGKFDDEGALVFMHNLDAQAGYQIELANGQRYAIDPEDQSEPHEMNAGIGFHGYENPGGGLGVPHPSMEEERLQANPTTRDRNEEQL